MIPYLSVILREPFIELESSETRCDALRRDAKRDALRKWVAMTVLTKDAPWALDDG